MGKADVSFLPQCDQMDLGRQGGCLQGEMDMDRQRLLFLINRALIVLAVGAILAGLSFNQWRIVLRNAILL